MDLSYKSSKFSWMSLIMASSNEVKLVPLVSLKTHPRQFEFFSETSESELAELAEDLTRRGQQEPIHICPDGTIVRGHRRVKAAEKLGWVAINAVVRQDLGDASCPETISDLINDNVMRRQLDELELARCYRELKQQYTAHDEDQYDDRRDRLAARLNCGKSGRSLDRLQRLLELPRDIQDMVSKKHLNKYQAEKILRLPESKRNSLFVDLRFGERVPEVLRRYGVQVSFNLD
jgi:ParB family chromosome partitioning protein